MIESLLTRRNFRIFLVFTLAYALGYAFLDGLIETKYNNPLLFEYNEYVKNFEFTNIDIVLLVFGLFIFIAYIGLFLFWNIGRILILLNFFYFLYTPIYSEPLLFAYTPLTPFSPMLEYYDGVFTGMLVALVYFSPLRNEFTSREPKNSNDPSGLSEP